LVEISQGFVSEWETGKSIPSAASLVKLSKVFDVSIDYLLLDNVPREGVSAIDDFELYEQFRLADALPDEDRKIIKKLVAAMVVNHKVRSMQDEVSQGAPPKRTETPALRKVAGKR
jgi:transcriptional regulator with XRE-family HTH domain